MLQEKKFGKAGILKVGEGDSAKTLPNGLVWEVAGRSSRLRIGIAMEIFDWTQPYWEYASVNYQGYLSGVGGPHGDPDGMEFPPAGPQLIPPPAIKVMKSIATGILARPGSMMVCNTTGYGLSFALLVPMDRTEAGKLDAEDLYRQIFEKFNAEKPAK